MKEPQNIVEFKTMVGRILGQLYSEHPIEIDRDAGTFFGNEVLDDQESDLFDSTVSYLVRSGYIHQDKQFYLQLTDTAWEVLQKPNPLQDTKSIGETLYEWMKETGQDTAKDGIKSLVPVALTALYKAITAAG
ncbi:hypothetical protein [Brucella thiophenivorans]|uniref:Uncharacterized protein n=1 Tax=Brucella thiophenivorans TaxID=571255 RepID=A0A256FVV1_9HYPH|nr:hypothetical protein [Brucella thiophenivorans]OYR18954.1 hypothetical protein CEV31_2294 [Brucella thiophenivorans]